MVQKWILIALIAGIIVIVISIVRAGKKKDPVVTSNTTVSESDSSDKWSWVKHREVLIAVGVIIFNFISWAMIPWWWKIITHSWWAFGAFNLGFWIVLYLKTTKLKDATGKETKEANPIASMLADVLSIMLVLGIITIAWDQFKTNPKDDPNSITSKTVTNLSYGVPMEVALPIIADCESGGGVPGTAHQFETDGITPLKNPTTSAIGKYQIMASLHKERAKKMGFDIGTLEGNEGYARVLYSESKTQHWEADPKSKACWEPKLKSYAWGGGGEAIVIVVEAPTDKWSESITLPTNGDRGGKTSINEMGKKITILWNDQVEDNLPKAEGEKQKNPSVVYNFRLKSREKEAVPVTVKFF